MYYVYSGRRRSFWTPSKLEICYHFMYNYFCLSVVSCILYFSTFQNLFCLWFLAHLFFLYIPVRTSNLIYRFMFITTLWIIEYFFFNLRCRLSQIVYKIENNILFRLISPQPLSTVLENYRFRFRRKLRIPLRLKTTIIFIENNKVISSDHL